MIFHFARIFLHFAHLWILRMLKTGVELQTGSGFSQTGSDSAVGPQNSFRIFVETIMLYTWSSSHVASKLVLKASRLKDGPKGTLLN